jgi:hypothetical protein
MPEMKKSLALGVRGMPGKGIMSFLSFGSFGAALSGPSLSESATCNFKHFKLQTPNFSHFKL